MTGKKNHHDVTFRMSTYKALDELRRDESLATFDMVVRELLEKAYPHRFDLF